MHIFLSTPISCFSDKTELSNYKQSIFMLLSAMKKKYTVCAEIETITDKTDYDSPDKSISTDLQSIMICDTFILHYPTRVPSSALIELGFAIAFNKKILIITPSIETLPYLALGIPSINKNSMILECDYFDKDFVDRIMKYLEQDHYIN